MSLVSDCCGARPNHEACVDTGICPECHEHCEFLDDDLFCDDDCEFNKVGVCEKHGECEKKANAPHDPPAPERKP